MNRILSSILVVIPFFLSVAEEKAPAISFTPFGLSEFRLRYDYFKNDTLNHTGYYSNRIAYKFGVAVKAGDQTDFLFEIGNDWASTEEVTGNGGKYKEYKPYVHLASMNWNPGYLHLSTGIITVKGSPMLDLIGNSIDGGKRKYDYAGQINWTLITDNSLIGLNLGAPLTKGDFKIGVEFLTAVIEQRKLTPLTKDAKINASAITLMLGVPMSAGGLTLNPQFLIIPSRNLKIVADGEKKRDPEIAGGLDVNYKVNPGLSFRAGFGVAHLSNENSGDSTNQYDRTGTNWAVGTVIKAGPGKIKCDFVISYNSDSEKNDSTNVYPFVDLKYIWGINKYFSITPRLRGFWYFYPDDHMDRFIRPEIIFTGEF
jgi:hypothetical protein